MVALQQNRGGVADVLRAGAYASAALVPAAPWLGENTPNAPSVTRLATGNSDGTTEIQVSPADQPQAPVLAVWARYGTQWRFFSQPVSRSVVSLAADPVRGLPDRAVVSLIGRTGQESPRVTLVLRP
jgi:hypothetical protein